MKLVGEGNLSQKTMSVKLQNIHCTKLVLISSAPWNCRGDVSYHLAVGLAVLQWCTVLGMATDSWKESAGGARENVFRQIVLMSVIIVTSC